MKFCGFVRVLRRFLILWLKLSIKTILHVVEPNDETTLKYDAHRPGFESSSQASGSSYANNPLVNNPTAVEGQKPYVEEDWGHEEGEREEVEVLADNGLLAADELLGGQICGGGG